MGSPGALVVVSQGPYRIRRCVLWVRGEVANENKLAACTPGAAFLGEFFGT